MAEAVAETIANLDSLVVEAGTGTGKTFAYLLPAMQSGRKAIISTGTKALQDQLFHRDLPLIGKAIGQPVKTALLKGRANYLCLHRLEQLDEYPIALIEDIDEIRSWRHRTSSGDRAELSAVYVGFIERNTRSPTVDAAIKLAIALELPLAKLIDEAEGRWRKDLRTGRARKSSGRR